MELFKVSRGEERKKKKILLDSALAGMSRDGRFRLGILERERTNDSLPFFCLCFSPGQTPSLSRTNNHPIYFYLFLNSASGP